MSALLEVEHLQVRYAMPAGTIHAVDDVSFTISRGETIGLVGESGCGKTTLGKAILGLTPTHAGAIRFDGHDLTRLSPRAMRRFRPQIQTVFQDPYASLNPRITVGSTIAAPLRVNRRGSPSERRARVAELLEKVGLPAGAAEKYPHEFSGGQRQRIAIARALALNPALIICDEPVSALDVSVQAQVINLLADLQREFGLAYLFISHDLTVVEHLADRILVMYLGRIVESASSAELWRAPLHPYTGALIAAAPIIGTPPSAETLGGDIPSPLKPPIGCFLHPRCRHAMAVCRAFDPPVIQITPDHTVACHLYRR